MTVGICPSKYVLDFVQFSFNLPYDDVILAALWW